MNKLNVGGAFVLIDAGWEKVRESPTDDGGYAQEWLRDGKSLVLLWLDAAHICGWSIDDSGPMPLDIQMFLSAVAPKP